MKVYDIEGAEKAPFLFLENLAKRSAEEIQNEISELSPYNDFKIRQEFIKLFGFAIPCKELINEIKNRTNKILDLGCGTGYLSYLLSKENIKCIAVDKFKKRKTYKFKKQFVPIIEHSLTKITKKFKEYDVLLSWPTYHTNLAYKIIQHINKDRYLFYIGEAFGGCTANDSFFKKIYKDFKLENEIIIPNWYGIHDYLSIYKRR